ncbi:MAG: fibronectin type III domain-containing protein [Wujia sp.]
MRKKILNGRVFVIMMVILLFISGVMTCKKTNASNDYNETFLMIIAYMNFSNGSTPSATEVILSEENPFIYKYGDEVRKITEGCLGQRRVDIDDDFANGKDITLINVPVPEGYQLAYSGNPVLKYGNPGYEEKTIYENNKNVNGMIPLVKIGDKISINHVFIHVDGLGNCYKSTGISLSSETCYKYNGKSVNERIQVAANTIPLQEGTDYKLSYSKASSEIYTDSNNRKYRMVNVTITGLGIYTGTRTYRYFVCGAPDPDKVTVPKIDLSGLSSKVAGVSVKWKKKATNVQGYQIQVAADKNFKKIVKKQTITSKNKSTVTIKGLKSKKKYWVRIRGYYVKNNKMNVGSWSKIKSIKTK